MADVGRVEAVPTEMVEDVALVGPAEKICEDKSEPLEIDVPARHDPRRLAEAGEP